MEVRIDGVGATILLEVRAHLLDKADAATLLAGCIEKDAAALGGDRPQRGAELYSTIAPKRSEHVAREALGMDPGQDPRSVRDVTCNQRQMDVPGRCLESRAGRRSRRS